jgi:hypothetical protein
VLAFADVVDLLADEFAWVLEALPSRSRARAEKLNHIFRRRLDSGEQRSHPATYSYDSP